MPELMSCPSCKGKVSTEAPSCPHCGQPITPPKKDLPKTYEGIPWYRQNWFLLLSFLFFMPVTIILLFSGPIYFKSEKGVKPYGVGARVTMGVFCILLMCSSLVYFANLLVGEEEHLAYVECVPNQIGMQCTAVHQQGSRALDVCWTLNATCANGVKPSARACQSVASMSRATKTIPYVLITNWDKCDSAIGMTVDGLQLAVR